MLISELHRTVRAGMKSGKVHKQRELTKASLSCTHLMADWIRRGWMIQRYHYRDRKDCRICFDYAVTHTGPVLWPGVVKVDSGHVGI